MLERHFYEMLIFFKFKKRITFINPHYRLIQMFFFNKFIIVTVSVIKITIIIIYKT
jgi:hypothetical protein